MDELPQYSLTRPSLHFRWTGSYLQILLTSPSLHFRWAGSFLQFILTKLFPQLRGTSSCYSHGRALPIQLHLANSSQTAHPDELLQFTQTSSPLQHTWISSTQLCMLTSPPRQHAKTSSTRLLALTTPATNRTRG